MLRYHRYNIANMATTKDMTLRAFSIQASSLGQSTGYLRELLSERLNESVSGDRKMKLNQAEPDEDLLAYFNQTSSYIFGMMLRITNEGITGQIHPQLFEQKFIRIDQISSEVSTETSLYKNHYYFLITNDKVIVSLPTDTTIKRLQTYLNWLLEKVRGECIFELVPMINQSIPTSQLRDVKAIKIGDNIPIPSIGVAPTVRMMSFTDIARSFLEKLLKDTENIDQLIQNNFIKADLRIYFAKKPKEMSREEHDRIFGAMITPISDLDGIRFETTKGNYITGEEIQCKKRVRIEKTDSGHIIEETLKQEMLKFIQELRLQ